MTTLKKPLEQGQLDPESTLKVLLRHEVHVVGLPLQL